MYLCSPGAPASDIIFGLDQLRTVRTNKDYSKVTFKTYKEYRVTSQVCGSSLFETAPNDSSKVTLEIYKEYRVRSQVCGSCLSETD